MEAVVKYGLGDGEVGLREVAEPAMRPDQVMVQVKAVGVCGSDIHMWHNTQSWSVKLPVVLGHEFSGVISRVGPEVRGDWKAGDRVTVETAAYVDETCLLCRSGNYNLCPHRLGYGNQIDGGMTREVAARWQILHRLPPDVSFSQGALTEPICVAYNALVEKSQLKPGETVVIQGVGAIGILALQIARLRGASTLIALGTDKDERRLEVAAELGAQYTLNVQREDPLALIRSLGDGLGADLIVDCTGASAALKQSLDLVRPNGRITKIGWGPQPMNFSLDQLVGKAVTLQGCFSHTFPTWEHVLALMQNRQVNLEPVIGGVYPLQEWQEAFAAMQEGRNIKSVLEVGNGTS